MSEGLRKTDPDYDAIRSRAFGYLIGKAGGVGITQKKIDEALEAGRAELRHDRRRARTQPCVGCGDPTEGRWCSDACRIAEDGPQPDEFLEDEAA